MYVAAFFGFVFGALIGLFMAVLHFRGQKSGKALGIVHGLFTVTSVVLLAIGLGSAGAGVGWWILVAFLVVAAGGAYLFSRQLQGEPWPGAVIVAHGGLAIAMIVVLGLWLAARTPGEPIPSSDVVEAVAE